MLNDISIRIAGHLLKRSLRSPRLSAASRRRVKKILGMATTQVCEDICREAIDATGRVVAAGPFAGMKIGTSVSWGGGDILPKLLGSYEAELAPFMAEIKDRPFDLVINVGAAEGYYAVGAAMTLNAARVLAVDIDPAALHATQENAVLNGVADKLDVTLGLDADGLCGLLSEAPRSLIISDCEGFELALFTDAALAALKHSFCLVECHDFIGETVTDTLTERFARSHAVEIVDEGPRNPNQHDFLRRKNSTERWLAISEGRPEAMRWLIARPVI